MPKPFNPEEINHFENEIEYELRTFIEQAKAILDDDIDKLFKSGFLDIDDYKDSEGNLYEDYEESALDDYSEDLLQKSSQISTAYEVDNSNDNLDKANSITSIDNLDKSYITITLKFEHMYGDIILSNTGEVFIQAFDKFDKEKNEIYYEEIESIDDSHQLMLLAHHIAGGEEEFKDFIPERNIDELAYYFRSAESHFGTDEDLKDFQLNILREMNGKDIFFPIRGKNVIADLENQLEYYNSILIEKSGKEELNQLIFEIDGNVFFHELVKNGYSYDSKFEFVEEGEEFTFKGETYTAEPGVLKTIDMNVYGHYNTKTNYLEEDDDEPEVKSKNKFKP